MVKRRIMESKTGQEAIPREEYFRMLSVLPVFCVDNLAYRIKDGEVQVLLVKRTQDPAKGCLYPIGKGLKKNVFSNNWALQALFKEVQMNAKVIRAFGLYEGIYAIGQSSKVKDGLHNPCIAYLTELEDSTITLDATSSAYQWVTKKDVEEGLLLPPYTRVLLEDSEIFSRKPSELKNSGTFKHRLLDYRRTDFSKFAIA